jgi:hypothetical protein
MVMSKNIDIKKE